ncbi:MAG: D-alanine--D-alanine ligase [bacterium]
MRIGLTYDLRKEYLEMGYTEEETAEFDSEDTIHALDETISSLEHEVVRVGNIFELARQLSSGERWDLVFNISEGCHGRNREAQVPALLEAYQIPYTFSDPLTLAVCLDKAVAKSVVRDAGIPTPESFTVDSMHDMGKGAISPRTPFPLFTKPLSEGTSKGITSESIVWDMDALKRQCSILLARYHQPVLVETYLPGREFTIGIVGTKDQARVIGVLEVKLNQNAEPLVYTFANKEFCEERVEYSIVKDKGILKEASDVALGAYRALGCRDAGRLDLKADKNGKLYFLEMNPLAGLNPTHSDLPILCSKMGIGYRQLISDIIDSALERKTKDSVFRQDSRTSTLI